MKQFLVIAIQTTRSYARDRLFHSCVFFSFLFIGFSFYLSSLTVIEPKKILLDFGLSAISFTGIGIAMFLGTTLIGKEIEKRTIYTILSKPIGRLDYLIGKFVGGTFVLVIVHAINLTALAFVIYMLNETLPPGFIVSGVFMIMESLIVLSAALFFSLFNSSTILATFMTIAIFLVGRSSHGLRMIAEKSKMSSAKIVVKFFYDIFPSLDRYNIREAVAYSKPYPSEMLYSSGAYFIAYVILLLCLSQWVFRRKDLT